MELVWSNGRKFNNPGSHIFMAAGYLARTWSRKFARIMRDHEGETLGKSGGTNPIHHRTPKSRERETHGRQWRKATAFGSNIPGSLLKSPGTQLISMLSTPSKEGLIFFSAARKLLLPTYLTKPPIDGFFFQKKKKNKRSLSNVLPPVSDYSPRPTLAKNSAQIEGNYEAEAHIIKNQ